MFMPTEHDNICMFEREDYQNYFPKKTYYANQQEAMAKINSALNEKKLVLFEGACGTGKTLSALVPSLYFGKKNQKTVIIATNVHQQMVQFVNEAKAIKKNVNIKAAVVKGKSTICPHEVDYEECNLKRENTIDLLDLEKEIELKKQEIRAATDNYKKSKDQDNIILRDELVKELSAAEEKLTSIRNRACNELYEVIKYDSQSFRNWLFEDVRTPEEVNNFAVNKGMCGYELLKRELKHADLVICNFHHILNSDIFSTLLNWLEKTPEDVIVIFDEAHNLESSARSHSSLTLTEHTLEKTIAEVEANLDYIKNKDIYKLFSLFLRSVQETYNSRFKFGERERVGKKWYDLRISDPYERNDMVTARFLRSTIKENIGDAKDIQKILTIANDIGFKLDETYKEQYKNGLTSVLKKSHILQSSQFISNYLNLSNNPNYYPILNVRRDSSDSIYARVELFTCIPKNVTHPLLESIYSVILMSATLRPFDMVRTTLGINRPVCELSYGTSFPLDKRLTVAVSIPPLFSRNRDDIQSAALVEQALIDSIKNTEGNVVIFFQNSFEAVRYYKKLKVKFEDISILIDEVGVSAENVREQFFEIGENGGKAVLVSYLWGTLSEGVDYQNNRARTVIIVGVGYPGLDDRMKAVESAYDHEFGYGYGWEYAVQVPTIRKIRQAMGRVVRSPDDYGARVLLDGRFLRNSHKKLGKFSVFKKFPQEEQNEIIDVEVDKLKYSLQNFFVENN